MYLTSLEELLSTYASGYQLTLQPWVGSSPPHPSGRPPSQAWPREESGSMAWGSTAQGMGDGGPESPNFYADGRPLCPPHTDPPEGSHGAMGQ